MCVFSQGVQPLAAFNLQKINRQTYEKQKICFKRRGEKLLYLDDYVFAAVSQFRRDAGN